jgi:hypothetical protein
MPTNIKPQHGHWGSVYVNAVEVAEVTAVEFSIDIEQVPVDQVGTTWTYIQEGLISGSGELRLQKVYSDFEGFFLQYVALTPQQLRDKRNRGEQVRPEVSLMINLDDPGGEGRETITLTGVKFWTLTGGFDSTATVGRTWPFTFTGVTVPENGLIPRNGQTSFPGRR